MTAATIESAQAASISCLGKLMVPSNALRYDNHKP